MTTVMDLIKKIILWSLHVSEDNMYGIDNIYVLVGPNDPVVLCDKYFEDARFHNKYECRGRKEKKKGGRNSKQHGEGRVFRLIISSFILKCMVWDKVPKYLRSCI